MPEIMLFIVILLPILTGVCAFFIPFKKDTHREIFLETFRMGNPVFVDSYKGNCHCKCYRVKNCTVSEI